MFGKLTGTLTLHLIIWGLLISFFAPAAYAVKMPLINQEELNKAIHLHIERNMPWPAGSMRCEVLSRLPNMGQQTGRISWKLALKENETFLGDSYIILKLYNDGVLFREESIRVRIEILREFIVSVNSLARNSLITENDVSLQRKWVRSIPLSALSRAEEVVGKISSFSIRANTEITRNMVKEATAVKRGKMVQVVLDAGSINITTTGVSEEDGARGAFIRIRNIASNKIIYARVVGESRVIVDF